MLIPGAALPRVILGCRIHGEACRTPWGYDEAHTDQRTPYTLDQLATRNCDPHYFAYSDAASYEQGWYLWRALRRDAEPNAAEADVIWNGRLDRLVERGMLAAIEGSALWRDG